MSANAILMGLTIGSAQSRNTAQVQLIVIEGAHVWPYICEKHIFAHSAVKTSDPNFDGADLYIVRTLCNSVLCR